MAVELHDRYQIKRAVHRCKSMAAARYNLDDAAGNQTLSVTVSSGVSALRKGDTTATVTERADKARYTAKRNGKNCVSFGKSWIKSGKSFR